MKSKTIKGDSTVVFASELAVAMANGFRPVLAFVFISVTQDRTAIASLLHQHDIGVIGATSSGAFTEGYQETGTIVALLLELPRDSYRILFDDFSGKDLQTAGRGLAESALREFRQPAFILCSTSLSQDGKILDGDLLMQSIEEVAGPDIKIFGGMSGDDIKFTGTYVFTEGKESDNGVVVLVLDEQKIGLQGMAISGWTPIGISRTVTESRGSKIYSIDGQPALELYLKFLGKDPAPGEDKLNIFESIGIHYPFQVEREHSAPVMRTPMASDRLENALICDFDVPQGSTLRFSMPPDFDIVEKVVDDAQQLKEKTGFKADALLVFSCAGRLSSLGPLATAENEGLHDVWDTPMAGFFSYGEYGRAVNGQQLFHSTTCCWVAINEKAADQHE